MSNFRALILLCVASLMSACGGGGDESASTAPTPSVRWSATTLDFGGASVGSTTVRTVDVVNTGAGVVSLTAFERLPAGVSAEGCAGVAPGGTCTVRFTFRPTSVESVSGLAVVAGADPAQALRVQARGVEAGLQALTLTLQQGRTSWTGALAFKDAYQRGWVLREFLMVETPGTSQGTCSITLEGAIPTALAGRSVEIGIWVFRFPSTGVVSTSEAMATTKFTQATLQGACYQVWGGDFGEAYSRVLLY